ncbi:MAG: hypothetical protein C4551_06755 [Bacillota bacterium]|nr:MAG: hypothetical protein C4551_06755 [Bacillota bacterium]
MMATGLAPGELLLRIEDFHGHLGPYVILGFRAGRLALDLLGAEGYFDLEATVHCGDEPPLSCFADGVQFGSGCTTGKGNLKVHPELREAGAVFRSRRAPGRASPATGDAPQAPARHREVTVSVRPDLEARASGWLTDLGDRTAALRLLELGDDEIFLIEQRT